MARRFGGRHSPGAEGQPTPARRAPERMAMRRNLLWIAPLPLLLTAFSGGALTLAADLAALALLLGAAWMVGEGLKAEAVYDERRVAKRPAIPRKLFASAMTGAGVALAAWSPEGGAVASVIYGVIAAILHVAAFGPDPLRDKGVTSDDPATDRVARAVDEGERMLREMREAIGRTGDRQLGTRVERFRDTARTLFRTVEEDPRDLSGVRRYLSVYLVGARDATVRFADLWSQRHDAQARADYVALLDDLEQTFAGRTRRLIELSRTDLDVEIGVLRDRLEREGVRTE
ncbi:5-bromo-4-chloroindolyl phosphate hydrolysis family protein [Roseitranquillus sediminis]|uniref:5-bromo-4-chloroindolyl phosphate hydrolysis family protein n=1 Tax=Roseitranquillus sediminis TaxID=2809051 RepID=UPI001D0C3B10|nr:5-bromo-4-chloroindolyl phosphate hydrolysis family protein [Roseitranquillus sediminis]MBM9594794.1 5-bromo-4-chloroindolyl phosphate hydrolysis family protein [Roseitranquillus sediminis]